MNIAKLENNCRVAFPRELQRELFSTILRNRRATLRDLARALNVSCWTLKRWRLGVYSIPGNVFARLYLIYHEVRDFIQKCIPEIKDANWGAKQGGLAASRKLSHEVLREKMARVRSFIKEENRWQIPKPFHLTPEVCEFFGIMLGDGCLSNFHVKKEKRARFCVMITGNKHERDYLENHVSSLMEELFKKKPKVRYDKYNDVLRIIVNSRRIFEQLSLLDLPVGKKKNLRIPNSIMALPWEFKRNVIKELLDTDGCIFARRDEGYRYPYVMITSAHDGLRKQLVEMLRERDYPAYIHSKDVLVRGSANLRRWMSDIGSSNPKIIKKYGEWINTGRMLPSGGPIAQLGRAIASQAIGRGFESRWVHHFYSSHLNSNSPATSTAITKPVSASTEGAIAAKSLPRMITLVKAFCA